ncbi:alpha/beta hydrolase [Rhizobium sp. KVB221]|uniref:Alpha/beta hydrolase n=1 Tax=Rhizobium setariae TaxID=2801340 RepID=A0A937CND3_9HYPH|nr:alpha/beta hydrolase [Rhizobium setariae]MBL0373626.1 alpha/beta hydrolase [Rhizobium setariae]
MTDYRTLIDDETWAFIDRTNSFYPPDTIDYTIDQQREVYNRMCREFFTGYPDGVTAETKFIKAAEGHEIPIRHYRAEQNAPQAVVLYSHGGGFVVGGLESHDDVCAEICHRTGYDVVSVDYRLAPEHKHPASFNDCMTAFNWVAGTFDLPIVLAGDSAGGNLSAAVAHHTRSHPRKPVGQMLIYPGLGGDITRGSYVTHAEAPMLTMRDLVFYKDIRTGGKDHSRDISYVPLSDPDFSDLPPTIVITAECDPLSSDGEAYRDVLLAAGVKAWWHEDAGLVHGHLRARHSVARARESFSRIVESIRTLGSKEWGHPLPAEVNPGRQ